MTVGALSANNLIASYSAYGPVSDGRIKPDLVTLGDVSINTDLIDGYSFGNVGTSQATSITSGCAALVYERYKQIYNSWPSSTLVKGLLMNSATDVDNLGPDYRTGYGNINMYKTLQNLNQTNFISGSIVNGQTKTYSFNPGSNGITSKIMLIWQDIEGTPTAAIALINDLDLKVTSSTSVVTQPLILDPLNPPASAITGTDHLNNVEQVTLNNTNGVYTISVSGFNIPNGATQEFFLLFTNNDFGLKLIYPNGGNILSPGSIEKITWEAYSMPSSGLFSIDYSIDGGINWTPIVTNLSSVTRTFNWTIPATFTNQGRVRVRQTSPYSLSEISDNNFNILGQPSGLTITNQCENKFTLNWTSIANATDYIVERLDESTDTWTIIQTTTTNSTTITEPNLGCYYYTIQARRTSLNIISEFAIAKKVCLTHNASVSGTFLLSQSPNGCLTPGTTNIYINAALAVPINYNIWWEVSKDNGLSWNATTITQTGSGTWLIPVFLTNMGGWQYRLNYINYANCTRYVSNTLSLDLDFNFTSYTSMDLSGVGNNTQGSHTVTLNQSLGLQYQWQFRSYKGEYVCYTDPNTGVQYYCPEYDNWEDINCTLMYINSCTETKKNKIYSTITGDLRFNFTGYNSPTLTHLYLDPAIGGNFSNDALVSMLPHQIRCKVFNNSCIKYSNEDGFGLTKTNRNQGISIEISNSIFKVYPNPTTNTFTIEAGSTYPVNFYVFSAEGKEIFSGILSNKYNLNVADWTNGYYFIKFVSGSAVQTQKLIINH